MNSSVVIFEASESTKIRIGVPSERPEEAISLLLEKLPKLKNVTAARLGLMEILNENSSIFTYTIGVEYLLPINKQDEDIQNILKTAKMGRWPISLVESSSKYFTSEAEYFYKKESIKVNPLKSLLSKIFSHK